MSTKNKVYRREKTERICTPVDDVLELLSVLEGHGDKIAISYLMGRDNVVDLTYGELVRRVTCMAAAFTKLGYNGERIAIIGETSWQWICSYLAVLAIGSVAIPMDKELAVEEIENFLASVDATGLVYAGSFNKKLEDTVVSHPTIKLFVPIAPSEESVMRDNMQSFDELMAIGEAECEKGYRLPAIVDREALAEMLFTSGTTGTSKCVMLSQKNIFAVVTAAAQTVEFKPDDTIVSVLPIHHTYELACFLAGMDYGMRICINDSLKNVLRNFQRFQPTGLVLVPLFVNTMYKKIWAEAKRTKRDKKLKLGIALSRGLRAIGIDKRREIFSEVLNSFGGRLEKIVCGGAALNPKLIEAFEDFGISIYEGFGITECAPLTAVTPYYARKYGSVGPAVPCCEIRIAEQDVNDKGYAEGEIQINGENVMMGYYNNPEANEAAFCEDGWFRTGDVGYLDEDGYLYITGRLKSVIVLENGKNVFPEEIEEYLERIETIAEGVVVGRKQADSDTVDLVAVVYPNHDKFDKDVSREQMQEEIEKSITALNKQLPTFKQIRRVELRDAEFEKTTSKKIKRFLVH